MKDLSIYIVEDEPLIVETIKTILEEGGYTICGESDNAKEAIFDIETKKPDLILADIMIDGELDGIEMMQHLNKKISTPFIFLTSLSDPETLKRVKSCDPAGFIVKPFNENTILANIELAIHKHQAKAPSISSDLLSESFFIKNRGELFKINQNDILFLEAEGNYCMLYTSDKKHLLSHSLKHTHEKLPVSKFLKVHRSFVINFAKIDSLHEGYIFIEGHKIPVSRSSRDTLMELLNLL